MKKNFKEFFEILSGILFFIVISINIPQLAKTAQAEDVLINDTNFPDDAFREYVSDCFDIYSDGSLSYNEIESATMINIDGYDEMITSLKGIEHFTALTDLYCNGTILTTLDLSNNTALTYLHCSDNEYLTTLDLSKNTALTDLICENNKSLTTLDLSKNTALTYLECEENEQLATLDLSNNIDLTYLECEGNQLKELNLSNNIALTHLYCGRNQLRELNLSNNTSLTYLDCYENQLTTLNLSNNTALTHLYCDYNPLTRLILNKQVAPPNFLSLSGLPQGMTGPSNLDNIGYDDDNNEFTKVDVITKPATYQYNYNGTIFKLTIFYVDTDNKPIINAFCERLFRDYEYKNPIYETAIVIYGNCGKKTDPVKKDCIIYTDILASYNYTIGTNGKIKASSGKVIVGITMSNKKPILDKGKIVDSDAAKIAKAKIKNGQITVTAVGKAGGVVYLWVMDTGNKGVTECCPINVKLAPKKLEVQDLSGSKAGKFKIASGSSVNIQVTGLVSDIKTKDCIYTVTVDPKFQSYVSVENILYIDEKGKLIKNVFSIKGTGLNNGKDTKVSITFTCTENGKKAKFTSTITA